MWTALCWGNDMTGGEILFAVWIGVLGFVAGLIVEAVVNHNELKETQEELKFTRKKMAELREGIIQAYEDGTLQTVEVIEITDSTASKEPEDLFKPF